LRDSSTEELAAINRQVEPAQLDSAALVAHALAGDTAGAAAVIQSSAPSGRAEYLRTLLSAVSDQLETHGFKMQRLMQAAYEADEPRLAAIRFARAAERLRVHMSFKDDVVIKPRESLAPWLKR